MSFNLKCGIEVSDEQFKIIDHLINNPVTVVSAGAGTGKTFTTVAAVLEMIVTQQASLDQFVLITFTKKAAQELRERLEIAISKKIEKSQGNDKLFWYKQRERLSMAFVGTIHSFCHHILKTFGYEEGVARESDIVYSKFLLKESVFDTIEFFLNEGKLSILDNIPEYDLRKMIIEILEYTYSNNIDLNALQENVRNQKGSDPDFCTLFCEILNASHKKYQVEKKNQRRMVLDSHDLLRLVVRLFDPFNGGDVIVKLRKRFEYLFIDEFQDTDNTQKSIVDYLKPQKFSKLLVVGDTKQSIYSFRSANSSLMGLLAQECQVEKLSLIKSRRPSFELLEKQEYLFQSMAQSYEFLNDHLLPSDNNTHNIEGSLSPIIYLTSEQQIITIAHQIRILIDNCKLTNSNNSLSKIEPGDIAILFRSNKKMKDYEVELRTNLRQYGIKVHSDRGSGFFTSPEIIATFRLLKLIINYPDDTALSLAVHTPYLSHIDSYQHEHYLLQYRKQNFNDNSDPLTDWFEGEYPEDFRRILQLKKHVRSMTVPQIIAELYESFEIYSYFLKRGNQKAIDNLEKLREKARYVCDCEQALTLRQFVDWLKVAILSDQDESEAEESEDKNQKPDYVRLMTIHRSKGLEFPIVIIPEIQKPLYYSSQPDFLIIDDKFLEVNLSQWGLQTVSHRYEQELTQRKQLLIEEEIRLLYVATTRAKNSVIFVGSSENNDIKERWQKKYSWQDEIRKAKRSYPELY